MKAGVSPTSLYSEKECEFTSASCGQVEINGTKLRPFLGRARVFFQQVCDSEPSAKRGTVTVVERKKFIGRSVAEQVFQPSPKIPSSPGRFEPIAFEGKKCDFIERINHAEPGIEFEAVDDSDLVVQPDMFGSQVAVAVYDPAVTQSRDNLLTARLQKTALNRVDLAHQAGGNSKPRIKQDTLVVVETSCPIGQMDGGR